MDTELKEMKTFRKLGFSHIETAEVVTKLNLLLANYHLHHQKLRNFHWNVEGSDFFELHEKFEEEYTKVYEQIDMIAERIRVFGKKPMSNWSEYLKVAEINEARKNVTSFEMVKEILNDFEILLSFMVSSHEAAAEVGDLGTVDMMTKFIQDLEKSHWMYSAWLKNV